jgi:hypothetical protein
MAEFLRRALLKRLAVKTLSKTARVKALVSPPVRKASPSSGTLRKAGTPLRELRQSFFPF